MNLQDFDISHPVNGIVKTISRITPEDSPEDVREILLEVQDHAFDYQVGQVIGVLVPGPHAFGHHIHFRLYTLADTPQPLRDDHRIITLAVKRCNYIDEYSGEEYKGIASNYLCDLHTGDSITITGPYGHPFEVPEDKDANLLMIGMGTGIAPFRAFVKHIYDNLGGWNGKAEDFSIPLAKIPNADFSLKDVDHVAVIVQAGGTAKPGLMLGAATARLH